MVTFLNDLLFTRIPMFALFANVFLLFTLLSAKKDASIRAFMGLLAAFLLWTGGYHGNDALLQGDLSDL